jgi:hypothetical protein
VASNKTAAGRFRNRRTEILFIPATASGGDNGNGNNGNGRRNGNG